MSYDEEMHFYVKRPFVGDYSGWCIKGMGAQLGVESTECLIKHEHKKGWTAANWPQEGLKVSEYGHSMACISFCDEHTEALLVQYKMKM